MTTNNDNNDIIIKAYTDIENQSKVTHACRRYIILPPPKIELSPLPLSEQEAEEKKQRLLSNDNNYPDIRKVALSETSWSLEEFCSRADHFWHCFYELVYDEDVLLLLVIALFVKYPGKLLSDRGVWSIFGSVMSGSYGRPDFPKLYDERWKVNTYCSKEVKGVSAAAAEEMVLFRQNVKEIKGLLADFLKSHVKTAYHRTFE